MEKHPIQVLEGKGSKLPFEPSKLYYRHLPSGEKIHRKWLSYSMQLNKVYCSCCMAFGDKGHRDSTFITGYDVSSKNVYKSVEIHENSNHHELAATAALQIQKGYDISTLLNTNQTKQQESEIQTRRLVIQRLIDIVLFIGMQGIAYRGDKAEAAYTLDSLQNHGNFLELVMLVAKYDVILQSHVKKCIEDSKKHRIKTKDKREATGKQSKRTTGRGSMLTFLSKTFINKLIKITSSMGRNIILKDLQDSIIYSVMVDSTQDIAVMDQLAVCVRYVVQGKVYERLLEIVVVNDSSGLALYELIKLNLSKCGIATPNIIACSFDGANNMKGCYNGLQAHLKKDNEDLIYTHCMAHVLNLVVADSTVKLLQAENLFGLVEESAVFLSSSHKRMAVWEKETKRKHTAHDKLYRVQKIGATRWWSKHKALSSIVDEEFLISENSVNSVKFFNFISVFKEISDGSFDSKSRFTARNLISQWSKFENLFLSFVLLDLFLVTSPVSKYLQSKTIDYALAWNLVQTLLQQVKDKRNDVHFEVLYAKTKTYARAVNLKLEENDIDIELQLDFERKRISKKKLMPGEKLKDEADSISTVQSYKIVYFDILDCARMSIEERFCANKDVLQDCSWLDPKTFDSMLKLEKFPTEALHSVSKLCKIERSRLLIELRQFAQQYRNFIAADPTKTYGDRCSDEECDLDATEEAEQNADIYCSENRQCFQCLTCAFSVLFELTQSGLFTNLYIAYKFVLTIPCTQVTCERVFSKLKIVKNRLRSSLGQELMSSLLFINVERDLFYDLDKNKIIDEVASTSELLTKKLLL